MRFALRHGASTLTDSKRESNANALTSKSRHAFAAGATRSGDELLLLTCVFGVLGFFVAV